MDEASNMNVDDFKKFLDLLNDKTINFRPTQNHSPPPYLDKYHSSGRLKSGNIKRYIK